MFPYGIIVTMGEFILCHYQVKMYICLAIVLLTLLQPTYLCLAKIK